MNVAPINVTILPAGPGSGYALAVLRDPFDDDEAIAAVVDLGPIVAWRFETYHDGARVLTIRQPVGTEQDPPGDDWTNEVHADLATHHKMLAAIEEAVEIYEHRHHHTKEN